MSLSGGEAPEVLLSTPATTLLLNTLRAVPQTAAVESFLASNYGEAWKDVERSIWSHVAKLGTSENLQQLTQDSKTLLSSFFTVYTDAYKHFHEHGFDWSYILGSFEIVSCGTCVILAFFTSLPDALWTLAGGSRGATVPIDKPSENRKEESVHGGLSLSRSLMGGSTCNTDEYFDDDGSLLLHAEHCDTQSERFELIRNKALYSVLRFLVPSSPFSLINLSPVVQGTLWSLEQVMERLSLASMETLFRNMRHDFAWFKSSVDSGIPLLALSSLAMRWVHFIIQNRHLGKFGSPILWMAACLTVMAGYNSYMSPTLSTVALSDLSVLKSGMLERARQCIFFRNPVARRVSCLQAAGVSNSLMYIYWCGHIVLVGSLGVGYVAQPSC